MLNQFNSPGQCVYILIKDNARNGWKSAQADHITLDEGAAHLVLEDLCIRNDDALPLHKGKALVLDIPCNQSIVIAQPPYVESLAPTQTYINPVIHSLPLGSTHPPTGTPSILAGNVSRTFAVYEHM